MQFFTRQFVVKHIEEVQRPSEAKHNAQVINLFDIPALDCLTLN